MTTPASAQRVLVVEPSPERADLYEAFGRLCAELELQHFEVEVVARAELEPGLAALERLTRERGGFAAISLEAGPDAGAADVYLVDRVTGKSTLRHLALEPTREGPTLLAVRAVDLLRTSLAELPPGEGAPRDLLGADRGAPPPAVVAFAHPKERVRLGIGALALYHPEVGVSVGPSLTLHVGLASFLSLGVSLAAPLLGASYEAPLGSATLRRELLLAETHFLLPTKRGARRLEWGPTLGAGAHHAAATGVVEPPLIATSSEAWSFALSASLRARYFFTQSLGVTADLGGLALTPGPVIAVGDDVSSRLGLQALGSLGLALAL